MTEATRALIDAGDLDELTRYAGRLASAGDWPELRSLRDACRAALIVFEQERSTERRRRAEHRKERR